MKKIIKGKVYNTHTAQEIVAWTVGVWDDIDSCRQVIYRANNGKFFLETYYLHMDYHEGVDDIRLLDPKEIWPLLADRNVAPDCLTKFYPDKARVMKGGKVIGYLEMLDG